MTESSGYNDPGSYDAAAVAAAYDRIIKTGYQQGFLNSLAVSQNTPTAMNVLVATGGAWVKGIWHLNPEIKTLTIVAADANLDRVDLIVVRRSATTSTALAVLKGTNMAAGTATAPALTTNIATTYEIPLASVRVAHGTAAITTAMITDLRLSADCGPVACEMGYFTIAPATGNLVCASKRITGLADPSGDQDADTRAARNAAITTAINAISTVPSPAGSAGKELIVNSGGTGYELATRLIFVIASASDTLRKSSDSVVQNGDGILVLSKSITIPYHYIRNGVYRISFDLRQIRTDTSPTAHGIIYVNGVARGTNNTTESYTFVTFSQDLAVTDGGGSTIELWTSCSNSQASEVRNFRIYCTETPLTTAPTW